MLVTTMKYLFSFENQFEKSKVKKCCGQRAVAPRRLHRVHRECNEYLSSARVGDPPARSKSNANIYPSLNSNCLKLSLTVWASPVARVLPCTQIHRLSLFLHNKYPLSDTQTIYVGYAIVIRGYIIISEVYRSCVL